MKPEASYRGILRSTSIMGGANALEYLLSLLRIKAVAILLGPAGVGLISLYTSMMGLLGTASGLGISSSGVREVALAAGNGDDRQQAAHAVTVLRRMCWLTGLAGWIIAALCSPLLSRLMLDSGGDALAISILGAALLLTAVSNGQKAVLQGLHRIGDIARINIIATLLNTALAVGLYYWLGMDAIVPVMLATAAVTLATSFWFARKVRIPSVAQSWRETFQRARGFLGLGMAFMIGTLLGAALDITTRIIVTRISGLEAAGIYQAAWSLSGLFASFILSAMGTDFYPRLTRTIHEPELACKTVNEQTEIGILLALPGLLATLAFAPAFIQIFYSNRFIMGAELLPWFVLGVLGRVISWPLGYILIAKGAGRLYLATETANFIVQLLLVLWLVPRYGLIGTAYALLITELFYVVGMRYIALRQIGFAWSGEVKKLLAIAAVLTGGSLAIRISMSGWQGTLAASILMLAAGIISLRWLAAKLGDDHRLAIFVRKIPLL